MKTITRFLAGTLTALILVATVHAEVSLEAARVGAKDTLAVADFYKAAFGMHEVNRINMGPDMVEVMLNFGDTVEEAKANHGAQVVIMGRASDDVPSDPVPHVIFNTTDINASVASVKAAGGKINDGHPIEFGNSGIFIAFGTDPAGNMFEVIQFPAAPQ